MHRHNIVLPTASLGASRTVRNEATSDARRFHENPRLISEHIKVQVPTAVPTFGLSSPFSGGRTQLNRRMLSHQISSTRWTPPTWCWLLFTAIGTFAVNEFLFYLFSLGWIPAPELFSSLPSTLLFFTVPAWPSSLCMTASGPTLSQWTPWTRYHFPIWPWFIPVCPVCPCLTLHRILN